MDVELQVRKVISDHLDIPLDEVKSDTELADLFDSLDLVEVMLTCEGDFDCFLPDEVAEGSKTVKQLAEAIMKHMDV